MLEIKVNEKGVVAVSGALTIGHIDALYAELSKIFDEGTCAALDLTSVTEVDVAALQVIAAFKKSLLEINRPVDCVAGLAVKEALELSGLKKFFRAA